jgi:hypothetical protein
MEDKKGPTKKKKKLKNVLFGELEASHGAWMSSKES